MKNALLSIFLLLIFSCGHKDKTGKVDAVRFPPPVVKPDAEMMAKKVSEPDEKAVTSAGENGVVGDANADGSASVPAGSDAISINDTSKKIVKGGDISFETNNVNETRKKIIHSLKRLGGYVEEDNQSLDNDDNRKEYTLKVRIPARNFDFFLDSVSSNADKIDSKNISISDS